MKKRMISLCLVLSMVLTFAGCGDESNGSADNTQGTTQQSGTDSAGDETDPEDTVQGTAEEDSAQTGEETQGTGSNILVAYFSWAENAILEEDVDAVASPSVIAPGNVQELAGWVQEETGGDLFSIQVTDPYPSDWDACLERANEERGEDARPELTSSVENLDAYDTVFLGYTIFSVMKVQKEDAWYRFLTVDTETDFLHQIRYARECSLYDTGIIPAYGQQLLTLSTCYGSSGGDGRLLIVAAKTG